MRETTMTTLRTLRLCDSVGSSYLLQLEFKEGSS